MIALSHRRAPHVVASTHRQLWLGLAWVLSGWAMWQGITYAVTGNAQVHSPALYVVSHEVPGGMRVHGIVMILLAIAFVYEMKETSRLTNLVLEVFCGYCVLVAASVVGSWWVTGQITFGAPSFWLAFAAISGLMIRYPPPKESEDA